MFSGSITAGKNQGYHFSIENVKNLGKSFILSLYKFTSNTSDVKEAIEELREMYPTLQHLMNEDEG